jgi:transcriptional regulator with XRE-family HTH domain
MPRGRRRLTPGLRREEVASLADIGVTWYTWLEQGREINVSADTLRRLANALKLSGSDEIYLFTLAGVPAPLDARRANLEDPGALQAVLDGFTTGPAVMFGPTFDVLGYNPVWNLIYRIDSYGGPFARNHVYRLFMDPVRRRLYVDYEAVARHMVGLLRAQYADHLGSLEFQELVAALSAASPPFARLWSECRTEPLDPFPLRLQHETLGRLTLRASRFPVVGTPGILIFFGTPEDRKTAATLAKASQLLAKRGQSKPHMARASAS